MVIDGRLIAKQKLGQLRNEMLSFSVEQEYKRAGIKPDIVQSDAREATRKMHSATIPSYINLPHLEIICIGNDAASKIYTRNKLNVAMEIGIIANYRWYPSNVSQKEIGEYINTLNQDTSVHAILVQLPVPDHIGREFVINAIDPRKDVDGFHPDNIGALYSGCPKVIPCTPLGCMELIRSCREDIRGLKAAVIGATGNVGKPMLELLAQNGCTVIGVHEHTINMQQECKCVDIIVSAVGKPKFINADSVRQDAIVIDVGITRFQNGAICGDVDFDSVSQITQYITPVPGGVGPMTIACLMENVVRLAKMQTT